MGGERARTRTKDGPAGAPPERDVPPRRPLGTVEAPPLDPGWEDAFLEVMRTPVRAGDHDAAQLRVLEFQGLLMSIDVPDAAALFARLNRRGDVLAMTFQHTFATATRRRLLARIESIAVHYEGPQPEPAPAAAEPAPPEHDLSGLWLLTAEDYEPVSKANAPTLGMKVLSTQHGHMAAVGATTYYDVELPRPMTFAEAAEFFYGDARPPELSTLSPDGKEPALRWRIGGPRDSWGVSKHRADFRTFFVAMRPEVQDALLGQLETQDVDVVRPDWYSQATADIVKATHRPPDGADIRRVPDDQVPVYVWRDGDVLYRYDTAAKNLQALKLDAGDDLGTRIYRNWVTYYIEQGWEIDKAMDQTVQDQREANIMMMGGFAMALAGATPLGRPRDIIVFARRQTPTQGSTVSRRTHGPRARPQGDRHTDSEADRLARRVLMKRTLRWRGPALHSVDAGFLHGDILALAVGRRLHLFSLDGSTAHAAGEHELPFDINLICVSNDGRWLLARTLGERLWVWDREHAAAIHVPLQDTTRPPVVEGFTRTTTHGDLLIAIRRPNYLDGFSLAEQRWTISLACETFKCKALVPMASGQHVLMVGAFAGESKGSLAMVDISHDSESVFTQFRKKRGIVDCAYELCAGPCGADGFVAFRDHDGDEGDDADDRENFEQIWGLRGAYVRRVDGTVTQTIELERWWKGLAPAAGGPRTLAVAGEDMIYLVDRATERVASVSGRWLGASPDGAHVLIEQHGELAILDL